MDWKWTLTTLIAMAGLIISAYSVVHNVIEGKRKLAINDGIVYKSWVFNEDERAYIAQVSFDIVNLSHSPVTIYSVTLDKAWVHYDTIWFKPLDKDRPRQQHATLMEHECFRLDLELVIENRLPNS